MICCLYSILAVLQLHKVIRFWRIAHTHTCALPFKSRNMHWILNIMTQFFFVSNVEVWFSPILIILHVKQRSGRSNGERARGRFRAHRRTPDLPSVSLKNFTLFKAEWCNYMKMMQKTCKSVRTAADHHHYWRAKRRGTRFMSFSSSFVTFTQTHQSNISLVWLENELRMNALPIMR